MGQMGEKVPMVPYTAKYTLAPKTGKLLAQYPFIKSPDPREPQHVYNCFLPMEWSGLRFNRKVVVE
jgi:hypothetical protein